MKYYYLQDTRSRIGASASWWAKDGIGYTTDLRLAQLYTFDDAMRQHSCRSTDIPWPKGYVDSLAQSRVDFQTLDASCQDAQAGEWFYMQSASRPIGNDLVWIGKNSHQSTTLPLALVTTRTAALSMVRSLSGVKMWSKAYIDAHARPTVYVTYLKHKEASARSEDPLPRVKRVMPEDSFRKCKACGKFIGPNGGVCNSCGHPHP